ncbi:MAG: DUF2780 domain-containing protein, partial [Burkholderiales bacterium]
MSKPTARQGFHADTRPLIAHIIHKLDYGGLENGVVNLINRMPHSEWRHCIICMTDYTAFSALGMDSGMIGQFAPVILQYLGGQG